MFTAARFTVAKRWKKPKCPSADEWTNNAERPRAGLPLSAGRGACSDSAPRVGLAHGCPVRGARGAAPRV